MAHPVPPNRTGLVLTAGGARGAYQAGVLKRIGELPAGRGERRLPFPILAGASAGAINSAFLATGADDFAATTRSLAELWSGLHPDDVFRTDALSMSLRMGQWLKDLSIGGFFGGGQAQSLLDFTPLRKLLERNLPLHRIQSHLDAGEFYAVAITATNYLSGKSFTFIQGQPGHPRWQKSRRIALSTQLEIDHICASSAIPIVFQPVKVRTELGDYFFGDGGLRLVTPLSPAIRLGAQRILAIGIRSQAPAEETVKNSLLEGDGPLPSMRKPPMAQIMGVVLNSIFLDHLDADVEHLHRINDVVAQYGPALAARREAGQTTIEPLQPIDALVINPSIDLGRFAETFCEKMPPITRHFLEGLGTSRTESADLMSYLLFDRDYTQALIDLGYQDAGRRADEITDFLKRDL